jgi:hypothetical protein
MTVLVDVNVLVYAFRGDEAGHATYHGWLTTMLNTGTEAVGLAESSVSGFVRIVTNPRIYGNPSATERAAAFIDEMLASDRARWLPPTTATWHRFGELVRHDRMIRGNLVPDAWLAALAISHGARLATADRGMARYPGLQSFDPASPA